MLLEGFTLDVLDSKHAIASNQCHAVSGNAKFSLQIIKSCMRNNIIVHVHWKKYMLTTAAA